MLYEVITKLVYVLRGKIMDVILDLRKYSATYGKHISVELSEKNIKFYGSGEINSISNPNALHEANLLTLDISKSRVRLDWKPVLDIV